CRIDTSKPDPVVCWFVPVEMSEPLIVAHSRCVAFDRITQDDNDESLGTCAADEGRNARATQVSGGELAGYSISEEGTVLLDVGVRRLLTAEEVDEVALLLLTGIEAYSGVLGQEICEPSCSRSLGADAQPCRSVPHGQPTGLASLSLLVSVSPAAAASVWVIRFVGRNTPQ